MLLSKLLVTAQYTFFLPKPWLLQRSGHPPLVSTDAAVGEESAPAAWWLRKVRGSGSSDSCKGGSRSSSFSIMDQWHEVAREAGGLSIDLDGETAPTADVLLKQMIQQPCVFQDLHAICCSPLQSLRDFRSSGCSSSNPRLAAFDCRLRLTLQQPLLRLYQMLVRVWNSSLQHQQQQKLQGQTQLLLHFMSVEFLQDDEVRQQCGVTSCVYQLGLLLLSCISKSSTSNSSGASSRDIGQTKNVIYQQPLLSLSPLALQEAELCAFSQRERLRKEHSWQVAANEASKHRSSSPSNFSLKGNDNEEHSMGEAEAAFIEAKVKQLFRPMTRQQQLMMHEQQVKRRLLAGRFNSSCSCCSSTCGCCGVDLAFSLLWGSCSSSSFFTELALLAGEQQGLQQIQKLWQQLLVRLRATWDNSVLVPRVVSGLTAATVAATAGSESAATGKCQLVSALSAGQGVACCPDGPAALPDLCCCSLQQSLQHLNCAVQQQRLQWLQQQLPQEQEQQPFESLRFVIPPPPDLFDLHEPVIPILPPVTEASLFQSHLLREGEVPPLCEATFVGKRSGSLVFTKLTFRFAS